MNRSRGGTAVLEEVPLALAGLEQVLNEEHPAPVRVCEALAKIFHVRSTEVALLCVQDTTLKFLFPVQLQEVGSIPTSSTAIAARTALTRKSEFFNSFTKVRHLGLFETVKLEGQGIDQEPETQVIQKLMTAPVLDGEGKAWGVLQVCRKGADTMLAGADFTRDDLRQLELAAKMIGNSHMVTKEMAGSL
jgi:hypothetical protein